MTPTEEEVKALELLEKSVKDLRGQMFNERAYPHHAVESAQTVETDATWLKHLFQKR